MPGILVIRGGAIGDFILTLPAIGLLREAFPGTRLEILGYKHIVALAEGRHYADATRSIEYAGLASFFIPGGALPEDWAAYFGGFGQVVSYLYDPDGFFEGNLRRAGVKNLITGCGRPGGPAHAARHLARPLENLALYLPPGVENERAIVHPNAADRAFAERFLAGLPEGRPLLAVHPDAGGKPKLWPLERWQAFLSQLRALEDAPLLLLVGGEADGERTAALSGLADRTALHLPLPELAAVLARCNGYIGHDSGISHLAAAAGAPCLLLFGPTAPAVWAPAGPHVTVLEAGETGLATLPAEAVFEAIIKKFDIGSKRI